jgi:hypothetical protein
MSYLIIILMVYLELLHAQTDRQADKPTGGAILIGVRYNVNAHKNKKREKWIKRTKRIVNERGLVWG